MEGDETVNLVSARPARFDSEHSHQCHRDALRQRGLRQTREALTLPVGGDRDGIFYRSVADKTRMHPALTRTDEGAVPSGSTNLLLSRSTDVDARLSIAVEMGLIPIGSAKGEDVV